MQSSQLGGVRGPPHARHLVIKFVVIIEVGANSYGVETLIVKTSRNLGGAISFPGNPRKADSKRRMEKSC